MIDRDWAGKVLSFWFEELTPEDWFERNERTDEAIRMRFGELHAQLATAAPAMRFDDPQTALAAIIVFDQFSRNMFRGEARAFATDVLAVSIARHALERGFDAGLNEQRKSFLFMPFMHSENVADQERCVALFSALPGDMVKYAIEHRDIVARFGRFPHRNQVLGRDSTAAERAFLAEHKGFGQ
jgi:uncharacterized protein (DUF924 family)